VKVPSPGSVEAEDTRVLGGFLRDVMKLNQDQRKLPSLRPRRNRIQPSSGRFETTNRQWDAQVVPATIISPPKAASWKSSANISARAGSKATSSPPAWFI